MNNADVTCDLLRSVSRTFYLSVRILPPALRETMGVAYLLARTSDTIADSATNPAATRLRRLADFGAMLQSGMNPQLVANIKRDIRTDHPGERALIEALPEVLQRFGKFQPWDWKETQDLLANIIRGQSNDLTNFPDGSISALSDADALEDYTYLVAGCVGEWWTRVSFHYDPGYARVREEDLMPLAGAFGKGLQLVNILRDIRSDLASGRCYLPADELLSQGVQPAMLDGAPALAQPVFDEWVKKARGYLDQGRDYIRAVRPWRIRIACFIPWRLAGMTLDRMVARPPLESEGKVKVPRSAVYGVIFRSLFAAFSNSPLK